MERTRCMGSCRGCCCFRCITRCCVLCSSTCCVRCVARCCTRCCATYACRWMHSRTRVLAASIHRCIRTIEFRHMLLLHIITFLIILPLCCHNVKYSLYYARPTGNATIEMQQTMRSENDERIVKANEYFAMLEATKALDLLKSFAGNDHSSHLHLSINIITTSRNRHKVDRYEPRYLSQVTWSFFHLLQEAVRHDFPYHVHLAICNVDSDPKSYKEAKALARYIPTHSKYTKKGKSVHPLEKEKLDYVYCLNTSLHDKPRPDYVFLVEDDALPHAHLFPVLQQVIHNHLLHTYHNGQLRDRTQDVAYVKFYHPQRVVNFIALERERLAEMFGCGIMIATVLTPIYKALFSRWIKMNLKIIWVCFLLYGILLVLAIGRANVMELRRYLSPHLYSFVPTPSCCTPAMLFPRDGATAVINYLNQTTCKKNYGKDSVLDDFLANSEHKSYLVQPNLFTHIGLYSSLRKNILDPFMV